MLKFWMLTSGCCHTVDRRAETNENGAHQAKVDGWSHFIPEGMTLKPGCCFIFPHYSQHITSLLMDLLCCVKKHQPLCVCINSKPPCLIDLHVGEVKTHEGPYEKQEEPAGRCSKKLLS